MAMIAPCLHPNLFELCGFGGRGADGTKRGFQQSEWSMGTARMSGRVLRYFAIVLLAVTSLEGEQHEEGACLIERFLSDLNRVKSIQGAVWLSDRDKDIDKAMAILDMDQGQVLAPPAVEVIVHGLKTYPLIVVENDLPVEHEPDDESKLVFPSYQGVLYIHLENSTRFYGLSILGLDFIRISVLDKNDEGEAVLVSMAVAKWMDSERIIFSAGLAQSKSNKQKNSGNQ